jgi:hypothetical protein
MSVQKTVWSSAAKENLVYDSLCYLVFDLADNLIKFNNVPVIVFYRVNWIANGKD